MFSPRSLKQDGGRVDNARDEEALQQIRDQTVGHNPPQHEYRQYVTFDPSRLVPDSRPYSSITNNPNPQAEEEVLSPPVHPSPHPGTHEDLFAAGAENKWCKNGFGETCPSPPQNGKFTVGETSTVRLAIEEYCANKNITPGNLCSDCVHKSDLKGAWMEIAKRLPHRTVQSVYRHGLRQLHPFKRGPWTKSDVELLKKSVLDLGKKWSAIQHILNRSADSCRDKYREMNTEFVKGRWNKEETEALVKSVSDHLKLGDVTIGVISLLQTIREERVVIPWSLISRTMGNRSRLSCFKKWQKMTVQSETLEKKYSRSMKCAPSKLQAENPIPQANLADDANDSKPQHSPQDRHQPAPFIPQIPAQESIAMRDPQTTLQIPTIPSKKPEKDSGLEEYDLYLLQQIVDSRAPTHADIDWSAVSHPGGGRERFLEIIGAEPGIRYADLLGTRRPLYECVQDWLERKTTQGAADTVVEAVALPPAGSISLARKDISGLV